MDAVEMHFKGVEMTLYKVIVLDRGATNGILHPCRPWPSEA